MPLLKLCQARQNVPCWCIRRPLSPVAGLCGQRPSSALPFTAPVLRREATGFGGGEGAGDSLGGRSGLGALSLRRLERFSLRRLSRWRERLRPLPSCERSGRLARALGGGPSGSAGRRRSGAGARTNLARSCVARSSTLFLRVSDAPRQASAGAAAGATGLHGEGSVGEPGVVGGPSASSAFAASPSSPARKGAHTTYNIHM